MRFPCALRCGAGSRRLRRRRPYPQPVAARPTTRKGGARGLCSGLYLRNLREGGAAQAGDRFVHNAERWRANREYALGWGDGLQSCDTGRGSRRN